jgi:hypothetical protein
VYVTELEEFNLEETDSQLGIFFRFVIEARVVYVNDILPPFELIVFSTAAFTVLELNDNPTTRATTAKIDSSALFAALDRFIFSFLLFSNDIHSILSRTHDLVIIPYIV